MSLKYQEKLKHPRWQKKRLEILERAGWKCESCGDTETTLEIHHLDYHNGEPWDIPPENLECLCSDCHLFRTNFNEFYGIRNTVPTKTCFNVTPFWSRVFAQWFEIPRTTPGPIGVDVIAQEACNFFYPPVSPEKTTGNNGRRPPNGAYDIPTVKHGERDQPVSRPTSGEKTHAAAASMPGSSGSQTRNTGHTPSSSAAPTQYCETADAHSPVSDSAKHGI